MTHPLSAAVTAAKTAGIGPTELSALVCEIKAHEAQQVNALGVDAQVAYLADALGDRDALTRLAAVIERRMQGEAARLIGSFLPEAGPQGVGEAGPAPLPDVEELVEEGRLERARDLDVRPWFGGGYRVTGGREPHEVSARLTCDCVDHERQRLCKHVLAVLLFRRVTLRSGAVVSLPAVE